MKYYIAVNGKHEGPYEIEQLKEKNVAPDTYVWCEGMAEWKPASEVEEVRAAMVASVSSQTPPPFSGASVPPVPPVKPQYAQQAPPAESPKTWLVESILVTVFCCLPFGIVGIIKASEVNSAMSRGDYAAAAKSSKEAGKWTKIGFWCAIIGYILYFGSIVILGLLGYMAEYSAI